MKKKRTAEDEAVDREIIARAEKGISEFDKDWLEALKKAFTIPAKKRLSAEEIAKDILRGYVGYEAEKNKRYVADIVSMIKSVEFQVWDEALEEVSTRAKIAANSSRGPDLAARFALSAFAEHIRSLKSEGK